MERVEFEFLRDLPGKAINKDILLTVSRNKYWLIDRAPIANSERVTAEIEILLNHETDKKSINVFIPGLGPICRLDVDSSEHGQYGRHHKHSLSSSQCPTENLSRSLIARPDLAGLSIQLVFAEFCRMANISHNGLFIIDPQYDRQP